MNLCIYRLTMQYIKLYQANINQPLVVYTYDEYTFWWLNWAHRG